MDPFLRANATSSVNCLRVAAAPVGLLGEQKKMTSVRGTCKEAMSRVIIGARIPEERTCLT